MLKFDAHLDRKLLVDLVLPSDGHHLFAFCSKLAHVSATIDVNDNAFTSADVPNDGVTRNRPAASGIGHDHAFGTPNGQRPLVIELERCISRLTLNKSPRDDAGHLVAEADLMKQILLVLKFASFDDFREGIGFNIA